MYYLPKPLNAVLLNARVAACLEKKRRRFDELLQPLNTSLLNRIHCSLEMIPVARQLPDGKRASASTSDRCWREW